MYKLFGLAYIAVILGLPWLTFGGWTMFLLIMTLYPLAILLGIFLMVKYFKNPDAWYPRVLKLMGLYVLGCLLLRDGGDGPTRYQGIEILLNNIWGSSYSEKTVFIPGFIGEILAPIAFISFAIFILLQIRYLFVPPQSLAVASVNSQP
jgi:hypothetical protein